MRNFTLACLLILGNCVAMAKSTSSGSTAGRFQIIQLSEKSDPILLDSQTGKMWRKTCGYLNAVGFCGAAYWHPEKVMDLTDNAEQIDRWVEKMEKATKGQ